MTKGDWGRTSREDLNWTCSVSGIEGLAEWLEDPSYPDSTMSWNVIHGK